MDKQTIQTYDLLSEEYDFETKDFWERFPRTFLDEFAKLSGPKILDVGCGPGRDALLLQERGFELTCLDASQKMVEMCRSRNLNAIQGDFLSLPFPDDSFDGAWAYTSLLHVKKLEMPRALSEIYRVLKVGGIFALGLIEGDEELYRKSSGMDELRLFSYYLKPELEKLLEQHKFEILYFEQFKPGSKNYLNFICRKNRSLT